jgi:hypothetical protein
MNEKSPQEETFILFEQVENQEAFNQGDPASGMSGRGYQIWLVNPDGSSDFLGFTKDGRGAAEHYLAGDIPVRFRNLKKDE